MNRANKMSVLLANEIIPPIIVINSNLILMQAGLSLPIRIEVSKLITELIPVPRIPVIIFTKPASIATMPVPIPVAQLLNDRKLPLLADLVWLICHNEANFDKIFSENQLSLSWNLLVISIDIDNILPGDLFIRSRDVRCLNV